MITIKQNNLRVINNLNFAYWKKGQNEKNDIRTINRKDDKLPERKETMRKNECQT